MGRVRGVDEGWSSNKDSLPATGTKSWVRKGRYSLFQVQCVRFLCGRWILALLRHALVGFTCPYGPSHQEAGHRMWLLS